MEYIEKIASKTYADSSETMEDLAEYQAKDGFFGKPFAVKSSLMADATTWWKGTGSDTKLSKVAIQILQMPQSTAATERSFSTYGNIHTAKRNRLTMERAGKLTFISHNMKLQKSRPKKNDYNRRRI